MRKIIKPEFPYTDVVAVEVVREHNPYADLGVDDTWNYWLHINLDKLAITAEQGEALLRNSREIIQATEQRIIKLLENNFERFDLSNNQVDGMGCEEFIALIKANS